MKTSRLITGLLSAALLGVSPLALAAPAQAAGTYTTTTTIGSNADAVEHGSEISISGAVKYVHPTYGETTPSYGTATLQMMTVQNPTWVDVAVDDSPGFLYFPGIKPQMNSSFRVLYSGHAAQTAYQDTFAASESPMISVGVQRKVSIKLRSSQLTVLGKVSPDFAKKKILVHHKTKAKGKWKKFKTLRTNKKGRFKVRFFARRGQKVYFLLTIKGDSRYAGWQGAYYTSRY